MFTATRTLKPESRSPKPALLHCRIFLFRRAVAAQQLRQVLRERGAGQDHIASHFVGFLLEVSLHVREEADDRGSLFQFALEFGNKRERLYVVVVQVEDNQRGFFFAVLFHALDQIFVALHELDLDVHFARRFLNLSREEQVVDEGKNARVGVQSPRYGLWFRRRIGRAEAWPLTSGLLPVVASGHCGAVTVIHGRGVNAVWVLPTSLALSRPLSALIVGTASAPPSASASATGGFARSCVHSPLKFYGSSLTARCIDFGISIATGRPRNLA